MMMGACSDDLKSYYNINSWIDVHHTILRTHKRIEWKAEQEHGIYVHYTRNMVRRWRETSKEHKKKKKIYEYRI